MKTGEARSQRPSSYMAAAVDRWVVHLLDGGQHFGGANTQGRGFFSRWAWKTAGARTLLGTFLKGSEVIRSLNVSRTGKNLFKSPCQTHLCWEFSVVFKRNSLSEGLRPRHLTQHRTYTSFHCFSFFFSMLHFYWTFFAFIFWLFVFFFELHFFSFLDGRELVLQTSQRGTRWKITVLCVSFSLVGLTVQVDWEPIFVSKSENHPTFTQDK